VAGTNEKGATPNAETLVIDTRVCNVRGPNRSRRKSLDTRFYLLDMDQLSLTLWSCVYLPETKRARNYRDYSRKFREIYARRRPF
jgi:hypothetical protein